MLKCGITGHSGTLGTQLIKKKFNFKFIIFMDDICLKKKNISMDQKKQIRFSFTYCSSSSNESCGK